MVVGAAAASDRPYVMQQRNRLLILVAMTALLSVGCSGQSSRLAARSSSAATRPVDVGEAPVVPGDLLLIVVTDSVSPGVEEHREQRVDASGNISLPLIGTVRVAGLTPHELERHIPRTYEEARACGTYRFAVTKVAERP
jgi:protein involved in polysaccharide export with SLBB domain